MKGIIHTEVNERHRPNVNSLILDYYSIGETVEITESVLGDPYDGDDVWYKLDNGAYIWSGAVDPVPDSSGLSGEDRDQWLICYRQVKPDGRPDMGKKTPPKELYFTPLRLPADSSGIRVNQLIREAFVNGFMNSLRRIPPHRKHVFVYIHGYQMLSSLKLDLLENFVNGYMTYPGNKIAKVIFFTWPAQGGPARKTVDDRSIRAGQNFTKNGLWEPFRRLSHELKNNGRRLNLIVHSFGHQLLNGMLNDPTTPGFKDRIPSGIFENIFLMAPDITHLAIQKGGVKLHNYFKDKDADEFHYDFSGLKKLGKKVHVFHSRNDYLLYSSTKRFVGGSNINQELTPDERFNLTKDYRNLGNYGSREVEPVLEPGFNFEPIDPLIKGIVFKDDEERLRYPFRNPRPGTIEAIDKVWKEADYNDINGGRIILNLNRIPNYHRYIFTCRQVVERVLSLL